MADTQALDALKAKISQIRADALRQINADIFNDGRIVPGAPFTVDPRQARRERLQRLVRVSDPEDDWDY